MNDSITDSVDIVVVGAGVTGLYAVHKLRGLGYRVRGFERGEDVGGVWYWNRYPGARCDVESVDYSYSFDEELQQQWDWSEKYATQPEIMRYLRHVADRFDLRRSYTFGTSVTSAELDERTLRWTVRTDGGEVVSARFCVYAVGCLSSAHVPDVPGVAEFGGATYHTGAWPHEGVDFTGLRVGVIGTGSSGIQAIPLIAEQAAHLTVFQRSANYSIPAGNAPLDEETRGRQKAGYAERRRLSRLSGGGSPHTGHPSRTFEVSEEERRAAFEERWELGGVLYSKTFPDQLTDRAANDAARAFWEEKVRALVDDPVSADLLVPTDHPIGTKRIVTDSHYYETFNRDDVRLVSLRGNAIERVDGGGVLLADGTRVELDAIVFATGFDAMTGAIDRIDVRGRGGRRLKDVWSEGPRTYLGLGTDGFPNLFNLTGPGSPSVMANVVLCAEQHGDWLAGCLSHIDEYGYRGIEASAEAVEEWVAECRDRAAATLFPAADSWYLGANIPGKPRVFMPFIGGFGVYGDIIAGVADSGYKGFHLLTR
ncbi:Phenylacetone monooxygenase [Streptomyces venezuelae]|uniref:flavin-containing monooxygenase n=1 Tax=Streptomyces gardneri TaxID=66892 RepID=UPI0006BD39C2|nr:NAD(P)/FAD-dependent oxidoreductase [Streptomyces gardneri]ALO13274.1 Phenylacetone monooxygenase [Streptomyces venezuelae]QPK49930.1 NAD(P)/FAD-dependent oxidoreductase [Streptomyces gardneri]WRK41500.1 NAD(P)/FAD-dependent oxidoreductase [Streptomyces venezuelae]CUM36035.1 Cyclohexanone monooxygenase [Streptomyces venezuelae]